MAATAGACTWFHINSNGLGVGVLMKCGLKIWIFLRDESEAPHNQLLSRFELDEANSHQLEAVVLRQGTCMYVDHLSIYHCHSNLENITGSCVPILFMQLLYYNPPSVMESIF